MSRPLPCADPSFPSRHRRKRQVPKSRPIHRRTALAQRVEQLEARILLSVAPLADYDKVSPVWFAAAEPAVVQRPPFTNDGPLPNIDLLGDSWMVRLTRDAVSQINTVSDTARFFADSRISFKVLHGLGLPGQILVQASGAAEDEVARVLSDNPHVAYFEPDGPITAQANTFVVDTLVDENDGDYSAGDQSLREALLLASQTAGVDVIQFHSNLAGGTIMLNPSLGTLEIDSDVDIQGIGAKQLTVNAAFNNRVFLVSTGVTASLSGMTITGGQAQEGGGIRNEGLLAITDTIIRDNKATMFGGGISNVGTLEITGSTISHNLATNYGGGIDTYALMGVGPGVVTITNTTISGNTANVGGGVSFFQAGLATVTNVTVARNTAHQRGGGIYSYSGTVELANTIAAGNSAPAGEDRDTLGTYSSLGYNLVQDWGSSTGWTANDLLGIDPMLNALQDNGGPTPTSALRVGSPAIDAGSNTLAASLTYDQRGRNRFADGDDNNSIVVDIGAYEYQLTLPDDLDFDKLWGLHNTGLDGRTADADLDAPEAWEISTGSSDVVVAVIDTGVDYTHPDLATNMWRNAAELGGIEGVDDDGNGFVDDIYGYDFVNGIAPLDDNGHGTHVAGIIGAMGNNAAGVTGVNWSTSIMAVKFLDKNRLGYASNAIKSLQYVTLMREQYIATGGDAGANVRVINASWITQGEPGPHLQKALLEARDADILVVAAAGNGSVFRQAVNIDLSPAYPASYSFADGFDNIIGVTATDANGRLVSNYNYGRESVDLTAPGTEIYSTWPGTGYQYLSGTSMAAPYVSGVAALLWSKAPYDLTAAEVRDAILASAVDNPLPIAEDRDKVATGGQLNAYGVLTADTIAPRPR